MALAGISGIATKKLVPPHGFSSQRLPTTSNSTTPRTVSQVSGLICGDQWEAWQQRSADGRGRSQRRVGVTAMRASDQRRQRDRILPDYPPPYRQSNRLNYEDSRELEMDDYAPSDKEYGYDRGGNWRSDKRLTGRDENGRPPPGNGGPPGGGFNFDSVNKYVVAGVFVAGMGAGIAFSTLVNTEPSNMASIEVIDQKTPNPNVCMANGMSAMVLDQRLFITFNPFNVYVSQAEVKPGCVLRQSNWQVLESRGLVNNEEVRDCKRNMNTFGFVGDLRQAPEINCVYHSETAENQFLKDPSKAALGDGFQPKDFSK